VRRVEGENGVATHIGMQTSPEKRKKARRDSPTTMEKHRQGKYPRECEIQHTHKGATGDNGRGLAGRAKTEASQRVSQKTHIGTRDTSGAQQKKQINNKWYSYWGAKKKRNQRILGGEEIRAGRCTENTKTPGVERSKAGEAQFRIRLGHTGEKGVVGGTKRGGGRNTFGIQHTNKKKLIIK